MNINKVMLCGTLTKDPDLRYTSTGTPVTKVTLAINNKYGKNEEVAFVNVVVWAKRAELVNQYCKKGNNLFVEGRLVTKSWASNDGQRRSVLEVIAENITFVGGRKDDNN